MNVRFPLVLIGAILLFGVAATAATADAVDRRSDQANTELVEQQSGQLAGDLASMLDSVLAASARMVDITETQQLSPDEYRELWSAYTDYFEGESTAGVFAAVEPDDLADFLAGMQTTVPDFELSYLAEDPPEVGHLIAVLTSDTEPFLGADVTFVPHLASTFPMIGSDDVVVQRRFAAREDEPAHIQVVSGHRISTADGVDRQAWTLLHVDLEPNLERMAADLGTQFGAAVSTDAAGDFATFGIPAADSTVAHTATASAGEVSITASVWSDGSGTAVTEPARVWAIGAVATAVAALLAGFGLVVAALLARANRSDQDARCDALTDLYNRRWLTEKLADRTSNVAVLFCDLDRFKVVNDSAGHAVGDELLVQVAQRLQHETAGLADVARWGGDEFVVLCETEADPLAVGTHTAELLVASLNEPFEISTGSVRITASIGIATAHLADDVTGEELTREADAAMGRGKDLRGSGFVVYDESLKDEELDRLAIEADLQAAIDSGDLLVYYQPLVDADQNVISYEALVRWQRNDRVLAPGAFLPLAAEIGRMHDVDLIVLDQALKTLANAIAGGHNELTMHVNVDASDLLDPHFVQRVHQLLDRHGVPPQQLVLEFTEGEWVDAMDTIAPVLRSLNELDVGLAIDDFGSGYSSLARLWRIPGLTEVKIDRLMTESVSHRNMRAFFTGLIEGLQGLDLLVISEGVETEEQLRFLSEMGVTCFQGYLFAKPQAASAIGLTTSPRVGLHEAL